MVRLYAGLPHDLSRDLIRADVQQAWMPQLAMTGPFQECDLHHDLRPHPMRPQARQTGGFGKRRLRHFERIEARSKFAQQPGIEPRPELPSEEEILTFVIADEQRSQADTRALRIGKPADHKLLRSLALHLQPIARAPV